MMLRIRRNQVPLVATAAVLILLFGAASVRYPGFASLRVLVDLFADNAVLGISAMGMTFVILSGGIDLSVGSVVGFATIFSAHLIEEQGVHPTLAWILTLLLGTAFGGGTGLLIHLFRMPAFLVTLAGMFFARGLAFAVSAQSIGIDHGLYRGVQGFGVPLSSRVHLPATALILLIVFAAALYAAHHTRFGRNVYAVGGSPRSASLMGLPVGRTVVGVYTLSGFCAALAGVVATFYTGSGNPAAGFGLELDAIAAVVIGGTLLSGGVGTAAGTLLGVLIFGTIHSALLFDGRLNPWWGRIAVGLLLLAFILLQRFLSGARFAGRAEGAGP